MTPLPRDDRDDDGAVTPREMHEQLGRVYDRLAEVKDNLAQLRTAVIVLVVLAGPKFLSSAVDVATSTAKALGH